jgi:hypothetical protein
MEMQLDSDEIIVRNWDRFKLDQNFIVPSICAVKMALQLLPSVPFVQHESKIAVSVLIALTSAPFIVHNRSCQLGIVNLKLNKYLCYTI